jgi:prepilin-type N-terminal cleavage/methylation domain-containing protein
VRHGSTSAARAGFTLVEVLLAMFVLLIGLASILGLLSFGAALARTAGLRSGAANAIEALVAELEETHFPLELDADGNEVVGEPRDVTERELPGNPGLNYTTRSTQNPDNPGEYRVDVEVRWAVGGTTRSKTFTTLLVREVPFGERLRARLVEGRRPRPRAPETAGEPGRGGG